MQDFNMKQSIFTHVLLPTKFYINIHDQEKGLKVVSKFKLDCSKFDILHFTPTSIAFSHTAVKRKSASIFHDEFNFGWLLLKLLCRV